MSVDVRSRGGFRFVLLQALALAVCLAWVSVAGLDFVSGDPLEYFRRMEPIFGGGIPYVEVPFEHFPLMLLPMALTWLLGGSAGPLTFRTVWVLLASIIILATTRVFALIDRHGADEIALRWVLVSLPMLPLIVFRTEPWVVFPVALGLARLLRDQPGTSAVYGVLGTAAKGWPGLLHVGIWAGGWRKAALAGSAVSGLLLAVMTQLPGFITSRSFSGLHSESTGGALWGLWSRGGAQLESVAGAIYIDAPLAFAVPGALAAIWILAWAGAGWLRASEASGNGAIALVGCYIAAFLLVSPLQSSQFVYWLVPFVVIAGTRMTWILMFLAGVLATGSVASFDSLESLEPLWFAMVLVRHCLIAWIGWRLADVAHRAWTESPATDELRSGS